MGDTFAGAAAEKANTFQGKMDRLKLILSETGETIGAKLIPVVTTMADWFLSKGLPALSAFGGWIQSNVLPALHLAHAGQDVVADGHVAPTGDCARRPGDRRDVVLAALDGRAGRDRRRLRGGRRRGDEAGGDQAADDECGGAEQGS